MYTDSHCHLENKRFDADRAEVFTRAQQAGVTTMLAIGNGDGPAPARWTAPSNSRASTSKFTRRSAFIPTKRNWPNRMTSTS